VAARLIYGSATARLMGLRVRILRGAWISFLCKCCQVEISSTGRSLVQRSPVETVCMRVCVCVCVCVCVSLRVIKGRNTSAPKVSCLQVVKSIQDRKEVLIRETVQGGVWLNR